MPPIPVEAEAPPDLVTPLTASAAASASQARRSSSAVVGTWGSSRSRSGKSSRQQRGIGETDIFVIRRDARHRDRALRKPRDAVAADVVGRDHRLALSHQHAQADIIAFRALGFLDAPVAYFYAMRHAAHRDRVGGVRAGAPGGLDEALCQRSSGRIDRTGRTWQRQAKAAMWSMVKRSRTKSRGFEKHWRGYNGASVGYTSCA